MEKIRQVLNEQMQAVLGPRLGLHVGYSVGRSSKGIQALLQPVLQSADGVLAAGSISWHLWTAPCLQGGPVSEQAPGSQVLQDRHCVTA